MVVYSVYLLRILTQHNVRVYTEVQYMILCYVLYLWEKNHWESSYIRSHSVSLYILLIISWSHLRVFCITYTDKCVHIKLWHELYLCQYLYFPYTLTSRRVTGRQLSTSHIPIIDVMIRYDLLSQQLKLGLTLWLIFLYIVFMAIKYLVTGFS